MSPAGDVGTTKQTRVAEACVVADGTIHVYMLIKICSETVDWLGFQPKSSISNFRYRVQVLTSLCWCIAPVAWYASMGLFTLFKSLNKVNGWTKGVSPPLYVASLAKKKLAIHWTRSMKKNSAGKNKVVFYFVTAEHFYRRGSSLTHKFHIPCQRLWARQRDERKSRPSKLLPKVPA